MLVDITKLVSVQTYQKKQLSKGIKITRQGLYNQIREGVLESVEIDGTVFIKI